jgi:predicted ATPase
VVLVAPLATDAGGDAIELFVTRARAARPEFALDAATTPTVVELCWRLDGIPLAIELAAARTRSIAPSVILERLDERFRMLTGGSRTAVARHQTFQAAVDWSYELLTEPERAVLDRLSVFAGRFTLDAAETVAGDDEIDAFDVLEHVSALVDKSLVVADPGEATYWLLETIRQYAADRLVRSGSTEDVRARHADYYRTLAAAISPKLTGPGDLAAFDRLSADIENLRLMLDWYHDHDQAAVVADVIWDLGQYTQWCDQTLRDDREARGDDRCARRRPPPPQPRTRAARLAEIEPRLRRYPRARRTVRRTRRTRRDPATRPIALCPRHPLHDLRR